MIMATELLNQRIKDIACMRKSQGFDDPTPTLVDIERTHVLFVNAHFKPFAAIAYEYQKVKPQSGTYGFNSTITYSIPQFGDFFNDMVINVQLDAVTTSSWAAGDIPAFPVIAGATADGLSSDSRSVSFIPSGTGVSGVNGTLTRYTYEYVTQDGTVQDRATATGQNYVRYCEFPGERLFKDVRFDVNGNPLNV
jgi:hypothetical protein